jgi:Mycothiol maleylpyruvate isomerase N-terminal domain
MEGASLEDRDELLRHEDEAWKAFVAEVGRVPPAARADGGVVPGWSVIDLVYHVGKWAGIAAEKLAQLRAGQKPKDDDDWQPKNDLWAAESKKMVFEEAMARALAERERAREAFAEHPGVDANAVSWFREETFDHYEEHTEEIARYADSLGVPEK